MRGLAARDGGNALTVGRADVRKLADRCWRKLVTHAVLTVRCASVRKIIAEKRRRTAESRGGQVLAWLRRRHAASAALSGQRAGAFSGLTLSGDAAPGSYGPTEATPCRSRRQPGGGATVS